MPPNNNPKLHDNSQLANINKVFFQQLYLNN